MSKRGEHTGHQPLCGRLPSSPCCRRPMAAFVSWAHQGPEKASNSQGHTEQPAGVVCAPESPAVDFGEAAGLVKTAVLRDLEVYWPLGFGGGGEACPPGGWGAGSVCWRFRLSFRLEAVAGGATNCPSGVQATRQWLSARRQSGGTALPAAFSPDFPETLCLPEIKVPFTV